MADRALPSFIIHSSVFLYIFLFHSATVTVRLCSQEKHENTHTRQYTGGNFFVETQAGL